MVSLWLVPGKFVGELSRLRHRNGCMGSHHFARDSIYSRQVLVSDTLKNALQETDDPGLNFCLPEDYPLNPPPFRDG